MKRAASFMAMAAVALFFLVTFTRSASADELKFVGVITKIEMAGKDAKVATATLTDNKTGNPVVVTVEDDLTLDKFKDHRIVEGDEIRCKYEPGEKKNLSKYFRKTAGC